MWNRMDRGTGEETEKDGSGFRDVSHLQSYWQHKHKHISFSVISSLRVHFYDSAIWLTIQLIFLFFRWHSFFKRSNIFFYVNLIEMRSMCVLYLYGGLKSFFLFFYIFMYLLILLSIKIEPFNETDTVQLFIVTFLSRSVDIFHSECFIRIFSCNEKRIAWAECVARNNNKLNNGETIKFSLFSDAFEENNLGSFGAVYNIITFVYHHSMHTYFLLLT